MDEEAGKLGGSVADQQQRQCYYGTFQGVANYYPPPQIQPAVAPNPMFPGPVYQNVQGHGGGFVNYPQPQGYQVVPGYTVVEVRPMTEHSLPCCGLGMGWFLFILGFLFGGIPWYLGAFILLCTSVDYREKPGYIACAIASVVYMMALTLGATRSVNIW
ncbi:PREDICTED: 60S ribosomal protein L18a-like protein isoform X1 [Tarenaya hassleriana]|uniref:60S ribosomal protein L18a-like protein isoform X1 n=1 Tax=Tarenaya hassleriana TaxID=28532 RepID=UPI00053C95D3|nr:PREDICTED: 60S ribosomal protein L18a-like protein isoform X1 [Tarenaya hassleriana]